MEGKADIVQMKNQMVLGAGGRSSIIGESVEKLKREVKDNRIMTFRELEGSNKSEMRRDPSQDSEIDPAAWIGLRKSGS